MKEIEICLGLDAKTPLTARSLSGWSALTGLKGRRQLLVAHYFDTPEGLLARHRMGLRLRRESGSWVQTFKAEVSSLERLECNHRLAQRQVNPRPNLSTEGLPNKEHLLAMGLRRSDVNALLDPQALEEQFQVEVRRQSWLLTWGQSQIELAFDHGLLKAGGEEQGFAELELELNSGQMHDLFQATESLSLFIESMGLKAFFETRSKAERGFRFVALHRKKGDDAEKISKATTRPKERGQPKAEEKTLVSTSLMLSLHLQRAAHRLSQELIEVFETTEPEGPHQARVALRQLRTLFKLLVNAGLVEPSVRLEEKASELADGLGELRDLDVADEKLLRPLERHLSFDASVTAAAVAVSERIQQVRIALRQSLMTHDCRQFILEVLAFAHMLKDHVGLPEAQVFANAQAAWFRRRVRKRAKLEPSEENLHRLRLSYKALRYASAVLLALGADKSLAEEAKKAAKAQDRLGNDHDRAVMLTTLQKALSQAGLPSHHQDRFLALAQGFLVGLR